MKAASASGDIVRTMVKDSSSLLLSVAVPALLITILFVGTVFCTWAYDFERRDRALRREIAENFDSKWGRCDIAMKWDPRYRCEIRNSSTGIGGRAQ